MKINIVLLILLCCPIVCVEAMELDKLQPANKDLLSSLPLELRHMIVNYVIAPRAQEKAEAIIENTKACYYTSKSLRQALGQNCDTLLGYIAKLKRTTKLSIAVQLVKNPNPIPQACLWMRRYVPAHQHAAGTLYKELKDKGDCIGISILKKAGLNLSLIDSTAVPSSGPRYTTMPVLCCPIYGPYMETKGRY